MIAATSFAHKKIALFGMGVSGLAAGASLLAGGAQVEAWDDSEAGREAARTAAIPLSDLHAADWRTFDALVLAPGVPLTHPQPHWTVSLARQAGIEIIGDTEIFCRERRAARRIDRFFAITGTNGKSTTTALTQHVLAQAGFSSVMGGNIGTAALALPPFDSAMTYVLEFSSFQIDLTPSLDPDGALLLNISPDHLDRHGAMENYAAVKARIFSRLPEHGTAVIGLDDPYAASIAETLLRMERDIVRISATRALEDGIYHSSGLLFEAHNGKARQAADISGTISLRGAHNGQNAAGAAALARTAGVSWQDIEKGLQTFPGLAHRMEQVGRIGRILFINDSKATNADAAARSLGSFRDIYWIAGGRAKEGGLSGLEPYFPRIKKAYLIGESSPLFASALQDKLPYARAGTLEAAVTLAYRDALLDEAPEPAVLLAPACASYDQFPNFAVRGDRFRELVSALQGAHETGERAA